MRHNDARRKRLVFVTSLVVLLGLAWAVPARANSFGGQAYSAYVYIPPTLLTPGVGPLYIADTGPLPADGGWSGATLEGTTLPSVLTAETLVAATSGALYDTGVSQANSSTSLANVVVLPAQPAQITASFTQAQADVTDLGASGGSQISELTFGGIPVEVTGLPNQIVDLPGNRRQCASSGPRDRRGDHPVEREQLDIPVGGAGNETDDHSDGGARAPADGHGRVAARS